MDITRRRILLGLAAAPSLALFGHHAFAADAVNLKISHQFPGGSINEGDFRDRLCQRFAAEIEKRTNGAVKGTVYAGSSLMKTENASRNVMTCGRCARCVIWAGHRSVSAMNWASHDPTHPHRTQRPRVFPHCLWHLAHH